MKIKIYSIKPSFTATKKKSKNKYGKSACHVSIKTFLSVLGFYTQLDEAKKKAHKNGFCSNMTTRNRYCSWHVKNNL